MDVLGAPLLAGVVMKDITRRGYLNKKDQFRMMFGRNRRVHPARSRVLNTRHSGSQHEHGHRHTESNVPQCLQQS